MRTELFAVGGLLGAGGLCVILAALFPQLYRVWWRRGEDALPLVARRTGIWRFANWLCAIGAGLTLPGLAGLARVIDRQEPEGFLPTPALIMFALGTVLWLANLAFRLTVTATEAARYRIGEEIGDWYEPLSTWVSGLWHIGAMLCALGLVGFGVALVMTDLMPVWVGWASVGVGALIVGLFILTDGVPVILLYVPTAIFAGEILLRLLSTSS
jgi:hypothetical protein